MNSTVCNPRTASPLVPPRHPLAFAWAALKTQAAAWHDDWRSNAAARAQRRALQGLDAHTLRDIGAAEFIGPQQTTLPLADWERGRW